ncbi:MAG: polysaccharide biosynthesis tyrosine autokinase [Bacteroidota bacterium]|nr:polysaccharide biosynthesis tyrosine autokinase [Bacteroidota bacterium]
MAETKKQSIVSQKDLNLLWRIIKSNWWVPAVIIPILYVIGTFYVYRLTYIYKASTQVLLKVNDTYYQANVLSDEGFYSYNSYVDNLNEQRVIQSYDLASQVVSRLKDYLEISYFIVGKVRRTEQFKGMPFKVHVTSINSSYYEKNIDFKIIDHNTYEISYNDNGTETVKTGKFGTELIDDNFNLTILREGNFTHQTLESLKSIFYQFTIHSSEYLISNIQGNMEINNPEYTNILEISLKDIIPERAILILDTLNTLYANNRIKSKFDLNDRTITYIDKQLDEISFSLKSIEDTMQNYKEKKQIINLTWQETDFLGKISAYDGTQSQLKLQLASLNDLEKYVIEDKDPQFLPPNAYIAEKGGFLNSAVAELYARQIELNKMYNVAKETNPLVIDLKSSIKKIKQDLLVYINNTRKATLLQVENVNKEIGKYISEAKLIPNEQRDIVNIQRKASVSEQLYNFLLQKRANTKIARASIIPDIKVIESPRNIGVVEPNKAAIQKQFMSLGLVISVLIIVLRAFFFSKITSVDHLKELTELPLVGVFPFVKEGTNEGIIVEQKPNSLIAESFRNFRTNLQYTNVDKQSKTYLITSFSPGEGKTFTSINLATILARSGKRTLLMELDLHKPRIYKRFGLPLQTVGLTTCISGQNTYEEIISPTQIPNLFCMFCGPIPPNPSEFVLSEKLKEIITMSKENFDYVIIDTPPAGILSDSIYLIQYVDSAIFVLNTKTTTKKVITFIETVIEENSITNMLLVLNGTHRMGKRYYYQGYGYSYGYGYGYGYGKGYGYKK